MIVKTYNLWCDWPGCRCTGFGASGRGSTLSNRARANARRNGWGRVEHTTPAGDRLGFLDLCASHHRAWERPAAA